MKTLKRKQKEKDSHYKLHLAQDLEEFDKEIFVTDHEITFDYEL